jgi:hypothetical protein
MTARVARPAPRCGRLIPEASARCLKWPHFQPSAGSMVAIGRSRASYLWTGHSINPWRSQRRRSGRARGPASLLPGLIAVSGVLPTGALRTFLEARGVGRHGNDELAKTVGEDGTRVLPPRSSACSCRTLGPDASEIPPVAPPAEQRHCCQGATSGRLTWNVVPTPGVLLTSTLPPSTPPTTLRTM